MPGLLPADPERFRYLVLALQRQGSRELNRLFADMGLTTSQAEALEILGAYGPISTKEAGAYLICESGSPSRLLAALAAKGLTVASQSAQDKRLTLHALTPEGRAAVAAIQEQNRAFEAELARRMDKAASEVDGTGLAELAALVTDPELNGALRRRFPDLFPAG